MSVITGAYSAHKQAGAAQDAANWQAYMGEFAQKLLKQGDVRSIRYQNEMWDTAQQDLQPYIDQGNVGLKTLSQTLQNSIRTNLVPKVREISDGQNNLPDANFGYDPITGQRIDMNQNVDLNRSGVLSPQAASVRDELSNYAFNTKDPVYQQKLAEKNESIDAFLAKQGLQGSSAGESFRQKELDKLMAEEDARQYQRATDKAQAGVQDYGIAADRGDTLYNRMYGQTADQYNRGLQNAVTGLDMDLQRYGVEKDLYNTKYQRATTLAGMGQQAASQDSSQAMQHGQGLSGTAMQTGANRANIAMGVGDAKAQGALASGQAWGGYAQNIGNTLTGLATLGMLGGFGGSNNYYQYPQYSPGYY